MKKRYVFLISFAIVLGSLVPIVLTSGTKVSAGIQQPPNCFFVLFNRCMNQGYFTGSRSDTSGDVNAQFPMIPSYSYPDNPFIPGGAPQPWSFPAVPGCQDANQTNCTTNAGYATTFINLMGSYINANYACAQFPLGTYDACGKGRMNAIGAAMIIDTMLGRWGTDYGNWNYGDPIGNYFPVVGNGINYARANFARWAQLVRDYDADGLVFWSGFMVYPGPHFNSTGMNYGTDSEFFVNTDTTIGMFIQFLDPSTRVPIYTINRACGNIVGAISLPPPPTPPGPNIDLSVNGSHNPGDIEVGDAITVHWEPAPGSGVITSCDGGGDWFERGLPASGDRPQPGDSDAAGQRTYNISCTGPRGTTTDTVTIRIVSKPYLRVYGGDVLAGSGFGKCTPTAGSKIIAFNKGGANGGQYAGAGTQLAAQATGTITEFASAALRSGLANGPPLGLAFANSTGTWGGSFGTAPCAKDYFAEADPTSIQNSPTLGGRTTQEGENIVLYATGNVLINGDYVYADNRWLTLELISHFYVIVKGNIIIAPNVTRLDGVFIAQPTDSNNPTDGKIYTCATRSVGNAVVIPSDLSAPPPNGCNSKLTVNGALIANQVKFLRSLGSVKQSVPNEPSSGASSHAAEVINYTPDIWLGNNPFNTNTNHRIDSITSLPPVL